ncbi:hypothetical protein BV22DRAFT_1020191 [Leucogyrophana mollusca]|uniref:Uncharacterized protein n=1 Tax=Leucogyrophana mollusca TaxID=85980 RepID=A0ACB8B762_9AGAM|nr:hypothetical protein BV22DRAFT_1020191 [Leucogyrophana mollusca]
MISHTRSEDSSRIKAQIGRYAAPHPNVKLINPPVDVKSRDKMGFNHPELCALMINVKHLQDYIKDPKETRAKLLNGTIKVTASQYPAFLYSGDVPGENFDATNIVEGLLEGYLPERVRSNMFYFVR